MQTGRLWHGALPRRWAYSVRERKGQGSRQRNDRCTATLDHNAALCFTSSIVQAIQYTTREVYHLHVFKTPYLKVSLVPCRFVFRPLHSRPCPIGAGLNRASLVPPLAITTLGNSSSSCTLRGPRRQLRQVRPGAAFSADASAGADGSWEAGWAGAARSALAAALAFMLGTAGAGSGASRATGPGGRPQVRHASGSLRVVGHARHMGGSGRDFAHVALRLRLGWHMR